MHWPAESAVPEYFVRGMSFDELLVAFRKKKLTESNSVVSYIDSMTEDSTDDTSLSSVVSKAKEVGKLKLRKEGKKARKKSAKAKKAVATVRGKQLISAVGGKKAVLQRANYLTGCPVTVNNIPYRVDEVELRSNFSNLARILKVCTIKHEP